MAVVAGICEVAALASLAIRTLRLCVYQPHGIPMAAITATTAATTNAGFQRRRANDSLSELDSRTPKAFTSSVDLAATPFDLAGFATGVVATLPAFTTCS